MLYREPLESDVAVMAGLHHRACLISYTFINWPYSEKETHDWIAGKLREWDWTLVAEDRSRVVGFVGALGSFLDQLSVDPNYQKLGIGTSLLLAALRKPDPVTRLIVFEKNMVARRLYERHGFHKVRRFMNFEEGAFELEYHRSDFSN